MSPDTHQGTRQQIHAIFSQSSLVLFSKKSSPPCRRSSWEKSEYASNAKVTQVRRGGYGARTCRAHTSIQAQRCVKRQGGGGGRERGHERRNYGRFASSHASQAAISRIESQSCAAAGGGASSTGVSKMSATSAS